MGSQLAHALSRKKTLCNSGGEQEPIDEILLVDQFFNEDRTGNLGEQVSLITGSVADPEIVRSCLPNENGNFSVFHLASMVSGECEVRFEEAMTVNLEGGRLWLDALKTAPGTPRFVFTSSVAAFGGAIMPRKVGDSTKRSPQTTYGVTKVITELLVNDYSRKGFLDGRGARLPTVIIRPGQPNTAASSFASGIFRERLNGEISELPVKKSQVMPIIGYRTVIDSLIALHEQPPEKLDDDRIFTLPSLDLTVEEMTTELERVAGEMDWQLGELVEKPDPVIQTIVDGWPVATDSQRALDAGLPAVAPLETIIRQYVDDFLKPS